MVSQYQPIYKGRKMMWLHTVEERSCLYRELETVNQNRTGMQKEQKLKEISPKCECCLCARAPERRWNSFKTWLICLFSDFLSFNGEEEREERGNTLGCIPPLVFSSVSVLQHVTPATLRFASDLPELTKGFLAVIPCWFLSQQYSIAGMSSEKVLSAFVIFWKYINNT